jgi:hypothetical protein
MVSRMRFFLFATRRTACLGACALALSASVHAVEPVGELPAKVVYQLYKDFAWVAVFADGKDAQAQLGAGVMEQPKEVLERYFDEGLVRLILAEEKCVNDNPGTLCNLEFDPIYGSSDPAAANLKIKPVGNGAVVQFDYPANRSKIKIEYSLVKQGAQWKIRDITYLSNGKVALSTILSRK